MSLFSVRTAPRPERRDISGFPWITGQTVPSPLQSSSYGYMPINGFQIAAVTACVGLRSGALAQLPLKAYADDGGRSRLLTPQPELLVNPSFTVVPSVWKTQMSISRDLWGYAVGRILAVDAAGYASKVDWLLPDVVRVRQEHVGGPLIWKINGEDVDPSLIFHIPSRWVTPGNPLGMSPLEKSGLVALAKMAQDFGRDWFLKGAVPSAILYADKELTTEQADSILDRIKARWQRRQMAVLGSGLKYESVSVAANESQFLETMKQAASDIAISFNLPPAKIAASMSSSDIKYQNLEQSTQQYLMDSINPDLVVVQESIERHQRPGEFCRWSTGAFLRSDLNVRYESYKTGLEAGFITVEEIRAWEELGPMIQTVGAVDNRNLADMVQKLYLGVGIVITNEEARALLNQAGGNFPGALPPAGGAA